MTGRALQARRHIGKMGISPDIKKIVGHLRKSQNILFITGAGVSADSGLPTYRGIGGLYEEKVTDDGIPIEMALAGEMLERKPEITWKYLAQIEKNCRNASFNRAHAVIAEMEKHFRRVWVLTQNIDGFHRAAGSNNVIDIHGDMHRLLCSHCGWKGKVRDYAEIKIPPACPSCGRIARPDVVFFGEMLPQEKLIRLYAEMRRGFDIYFSVGTMSVFPYVREPILQARAAEAVTVEINPGHTEVSHLADIKLSLRAAEALDTIWKEYQETR